VSEHWSVVESVIDENPLRPLLGPFLDKYVIRFEGTDNDDDEMGHLQTGSSDNQCLARSIPEDWD